MVRPRNDTRRNRCHQGPAQALDAKYFELISKYLQHCTRLRHDHDRGWDVEAMLAEINPVITAFEKAFRR